jgi:xanthine dehydrogenase accessory factor
MEALVTPAFYVGALGSRANNAKRRARLASLELPQTVIARLHGPVGLPIGSRTPAEIAVAILAELTAVRNGVELCAQNSLIRADAQPGMDSGAAICAGSRASF